MKFLGIGVKIKKSRMWIPALGAVIAYGFLHNCAIAPHQGCEVDWSNLILAFSIVIGLGGAREVVMMKFKHLWAPEKMAPSTESTSWLTNKIWIPFIGWCLVAGYANNFVLEPYFHFPIVNWECLQASLSIMLACSGAREYGMYSQKDKDLKSENGAIEPTE